MDLHDFSQKLISQFKDIRIKKGWDFTQWYLWASYYPNMDYVQESYWIRKFFQYAERRAKECPKSWAYKRITIEPKPWLSIPLSKEVYIVHDGSNIRESHAKKMESLAKVKDLSGNWVNGYNSFNSIAITDIDQKIHPLSFSAYSQGESHYNSSIGGYSEQEIV
jgi:hypothetical protein